MMFVSAPPPPPPPMMAAAPPPPPPPAEPMPVFSAAQQMCTAMPALSAYSGPSPSTSSGLFSTQPHLALPPDQPTLTRRFWQNDHRCNPTFRFDATRPPPPVPLSINRKRALGSCEAGPSKTRKECSTIVDSLCENCVQREIRINLHKQKINVLEVAEDDYSLAYRKKLEEYEKGKEMLRDLVDPELYRYLVDYIEEAPHMQERDLHHQYRQRLFMAGSSPVNTPLRLLMQFLANPTSDLNAASAEEVTLLQALAALRRTRAPSPHRTSVLDILRNSSAQLLEARSPDSDGNSGSVSNFNSRFSNGQKEDSASGHGHYSPSSIRAPPQASVGASQPLQGPPPGLYQPYYYSAAPAPPQAPSAVPPQSGPSNRPYYPQQYCPPNNALFPNLGYNSGRMSNPQMPMRPASSNFNQYLMGPQYYPPYQ